MSDLITMMSAAAGQVGGDYQISRSLRFNSADSAYLSRTPASAGNRKTWTWSGWVKRSQADARGTLLSAGVADSSETILYFETSGTLYFFDRGDSVNVQTTQVFRDVSAWYHIVFVLDTTQATSTNRIKIYINGSEVTSFSSTSYPSLDGLTSINNNVLHYIGLISSSALIYNGYLADINFIDGQALTPSSFGETDATTGVWKPKEYTGTYGTNGFYLDFSDNTSTTTLGYDAAGSNDWTPNNFSVTAGAGNDSLVDVPTRNTEDVDTGAGGEVRGNYCTLNPLDSNATLSNGNLDVTRDSATAHLGTRATVGITSGKWYWEVTYASAGGAEGTSATGVALSTWTETTYCGDTGSWSYHSNGQKYLNGAAGAAYGATYTTGDIIGIAFDADAGTITAYKNGASQGQLVSGLTSGPYFPAASVFNASAWNFNFGQRPFAYPLSGFKALVTTNLPEGTITTSGTFTGNGSTDGPFVYLNGVPTAMTIDGNAVTFGTHADKLSNGFKVRSSSASYNANATSMSYTISTTGAKFKYANAQPNP